MKRRKRPPSRPTPRRSRFPTGVAVTVLVVITGAVLSTWKPWEQRTPVPAAVPNTPLDSVLSRLSSNSVAQPLPVPTNALPAPNDMAGLLNEGTARLNRADPEGALEMYRQALKLNPDDEEVHFNMAFALARLGRTNDAMASYTEALRILPDYAEAHINLGNLLVGLRRHTEAIEHFSTALKVNPESSSAMNQLGLCLIDLGRTSEAVIQFKEAVRLHPQYLEARFNLAGSQMKQGNFDEAISHYELLLKMEPGFVPARSGLERARARKAEGKQP